MKCVSCGSVLEENAAYCTVCGAYQPQMGRLFAEAPRPAELPAERAVSGKKFLGLFKRKPSYRCETLQALDRLTERTPVTLELNDDEQRLFILKGAVQLSLAYHQILDFTVRRTQGEDKNLLDLLQSAIGINRRWIATLTYQTQDTGAVKRLEFAELSSDGYYKEAEMSGKAKRFEKAMDRIIQHYHPCGQLD